MALKDFRDWEELWEILNAFFTCDEKLKGHFQKRNVEVMSLIRALCQSDWVISGQEEKIRAVRNGGRRIRGWDGLGEGSSPYGDREVEKTHPFGRPKHPKGPLTQWVDFTAGFVCHKILEVSNGCYRKSNDMHFMPGGWEGAGGDRVQGKSQGDDGPSPFPL